ncbi:hypothetical protein CP973_02080 [Streptomyces albofaciens JCM 4342]|uniref:hypothetical protein n=1 Tax=Streptomyces albofaciens TaxID=66866 RepID=UPI001239E45C|nr:hypothetical protein [Streptomyces albofaciens]KAA6220934.1 hypothetical protein CP973_02080 [Streptomyces albofaciens JCM 4342]
MLKRLAAALGCITLAFGGAVAIAPTAQATPQSCYYYVLEQYPGADEEVAERACRVGGQGGRENFRACYFELRKDHVPAVVAGEACRRAARG